MWLALLLGSVFLAWLLQSMVFQKNWRKGLDVSVEFSTPGIFEGESSTLKEVVTNSKRLPVVAVSVRLAFSRNLEFVRAAKENAGVSDQTYKRDIFSLLPMQKITRRLPFVGKRRGYYAIENADVSAYDYFFHKGYYAAFPQTAHLYVYPKPVDTSRLQLISRAISGMIVSQSKLIPDPFEFAGIREYRREDPMNRINWKASARTGELMVNQPDATTEHHVTILLDLDDPYILKNEALLEESIRITAGLAAQLIRAKMPVRVLSNCAQAIPVPDAICGAKQSSQTVHRASMENAPAQSATQVSAPETSPVGAAQTPLHVEISATSGNLTPLLQDLAGLDTSQICTSMDALIASELTAKRAQQIYVVISKNNTQELAASLEPLQASGCLPMMVCPVKRYDTDSRYESAHVPLLYWEVEP
jgi:uncharacterized protein (DUF58 family)